MVAISKVIGVLSSGCLLCLGLSNAASADNMKAGEPQRNSGHVVQPEMTMQKQELHVIQGDVLRVEGTNYVVKGLDGREVSLHTDNTTVRNGNVKPGDRVEAKINEQNHALSILQVP